MWSKFKSLVGRIVITIGILAGLVLVVAVRPQSSAPKDRITIKIWQVTGAEDTEPVVPTWFNDSQDKIYVEEVGIPFLEIEQKFLTSAVGNFPPDLFQYFGSVAQWSTRGALLPLDEYMERDGFDRSKIFPALWDEMMWNGQTFAVPTGTANEAFYWNKEHFREAGLDPERPPKTWKELEEYAIKLTKYADDGSIERAGYIPGYWSPFPTSLFLNWPIQKGAQFVDESGTKVMLAEEPNIEALEWEKNLFEKIGRDKLIQARSSYGYGSQHGFMSGRLSMIVQKSSFVDELEKFGPDIDYGVSMIPYPEDGHPATTAGPVWIGIPNGSQNPEAAWEFIKFSVRADIQERVAKYNVSKQLAAFFPSNIEAANSEFQLSRPHMKVFVESMKWGRSPTVIPLAHAQFWREYQTAWDNVMRGEQEPREALEAAEKVVQHALDEQLAYNLFYSAYVKEKLAESN